MSLGITKEQEIVLVIKGLISELSLENQEDCRHLVSQIRGLSQVRKDGVELGRLALALVGAELSNE